MVVGITGILASIAIPSYVKLTFKAKTAEAATNLGGINAAMLAYQATFDGFLSITVEPQLPVSGQKKSWSRLPVSALPIPQNGQVSFATIGFEPTADVFYHYGCVASQEAFRCEAASEFDGVPPNGVFRISFSDSLTPTLLTGPFDATAIQLWNQGVENLRPWVY